MYRARKQMPNENEKEIVRPVDTIQFDKDNDGDLMQLINNYAAAFNKYVMKKTPARNAIRNLLLNVLPKKTNELTNGTRQLAGG